MSAEIKVQCPSCQQKIAVPIELSGRSIACPECGQMFLAAIRIDHAEPLPVPEIATLPPALTTHPVPMPPADIQGPRGFRRPARQALASPWVVIPGCGFIALIIISTIAHWGPSETPLMPGVAAALDRLVAGIIFVLFAVACLGIYLLPVLIAWYRRHRNTLGIIIVTVCLGWTFVLWVVAIIWALWADQSRRPAGPVPRNRAEAEKMS